MKSKASVLICTSAFYPHIRIQYPQFSCAFYRLQHPHIKISPLVVVIVPPRQHQNCRCYSTVNSCVKYMQQTTLTECRRGSTGSVAVSHAGDRGSNPRLYHIFCLFFIKCAVFTRLGIRLGLVFLGLGIASLAALRY